MMGDGMVSARDIVAAYMLVDYSASVIRGADASHGQAMCKETGNNFVWWGRTCSANRIFGTQPCVAVF